MPSISITGDGADRTVALDKNEVVFGRHYKADVRLKDAKASRQHFRLVRNGVGWKVIDCGSHNGTFLNGAPVKENLLRPGDRLQVGMTVLTFVEDAQAPALKPAPAPVPAAREPAPAATSVAERLTKPSALAKRAADTKSARGRASERFVNEATRKGVSPLGIVIGICAVVLLGITVYEWARRPALDVAALTQKIEALQSAGAELEAKLDFDPAVAKYEEALHLARPIRGLAERAKVLDARIRQARAAQERHEEGAAEWEKVKVGAQKAAAGSAEVQTLLKRANDLLATAKELKVAWVKDLESAVKTLQEKVDLPPAEQFFKYRVELAERLRLDKVEEGHFGPAIKWWRTEFLPKSRDDAVRRKVEDEIGRLNNVAKEAAQRATASAESLAKRDGWAHAAAFLERAMARFEGSDSEAVLRDAIKKYK